MKLAEGTGYAEVRFHLIWLGSHQLLLFSFACILSVVKLRHCIRHSPTLTLCRPDGPLIKYPQFPGILNALNVQPHNIFLLTV